MTNAGPLTDASRAGVVFLPVDPPAHVPDFTTPQGRAAKADQYETARNKAALGLLVVLAVLSGLLLADGAYNAMHDYNAARVEAGW